MALPRRPETLMADSLVLILSHSAGDAGKTNIVQSHHRRTRGVPVTVQLEQKSAWDLCVVILARSAAPDVLVSIPLCDLDVIRCIDVRQIQATSVPLVHRRMSLSLQSMDPSSSPPTPPSKLHAFEIRTTTGRVLARLQAPTLRIFRRWVTLLETTVDAARLETATLESVVTQCIEAAEREAKRERELILSALTGPPVRESSSTEKPPRPDSRATWSSGDQDDTDEDDYVSHPWTALGYIVDRRGHPSTPGMTWLYLRAPDSTRDKTRVRRAQTTTAIFP
ncbi:hypothetical protein P43SY_003335 [Pythium insidiosum]|uniref:Uncharacterized protein n=1 Tax=Pythium insidiosum TaxID=114742 RepID=A0AAD5Q893_PYTIN|nr:hypothetical protein P43SY_003335 [Pythium insidiosum]